MPDLSEANTAAPNAPGWYKDPESGAAQHVATPAGADALARLGWKSVEGPDPAKDPKAADAFHLKIQGKNSPLLPAGTSNGAEEEAIGEDESEQTSEHEVSEKDTQEEQDNYKEVTLDSGEKRYFKNGKRISEEQFLAETGAGEETEKTEGDETQTQPEA